MSYHITVCAFYKFVTLEDYCDLQIPLKEFCQRHNIYGTILLAYEGFNGTVAGSADAIAALKQRFQQDARLQGSEMKDSSAQAMPFERMKVRTKREIVAFGSPGLKVSERRGTYIEPKDWNRMILDRDLPLIDTRNDYEYALGSFPGAIDPQTKTFRDFKDYVATLDPAQTPEVAMFCTGGIRCEKASTYMLQQGFHEVYHLKGGILQYLEDVQEDNRWEGECFVFDNRIALQKGLHLGESRYCRNCGRSLRPEDLTKGKHWIHGVSCRHCFEGDLEKKAGLGKTGITTA